MATGFEQTRPREVSSITWNWRDPPEPIWPLLVSGGLVLAGLAVATVGALDQDPSFRGLLPATVSDEAQLAMIAAGGTVAGAAFLGGAIYYLAGPGKPRPPGFASGVSLAPWRAGDATFLTLATRF